MTTAERNSVLKKKYRDVPVLVGTFSLPLMMAGGNRY